MRGDMGVFIVVGTALMFLAFAAMAVTVASQPDLEDLFYNQYMVLPSALQATSDAVSACTGYAIVQALDNSSDPHHSISSVTESNVNKYFNTCISTALNRIKSAASSLGPLVSLTPSLAISCGSGGTDCSKVDVSGQVIYEFNIDRVVSGVRIRRDFSGSVPIDKNASVVDTGNVWVGDPTTPADDRNVYRILVYDKKLGRYEVNGIWPR